MSLPLIAVVAFDQISPFHLSVPSVVFGDGLRHNPAFDIRTCSAEGSRLSTSAGYTIEVEHGLELLENAQIVIVPSWRNPDERPPQPLLDALIAVNQRGGKIVGLCLGAYVLAEAGLLDGRSATTHWAYADDFSQRYPSIQLDADVLYVEEHNLLTSAGTAAGIDCCLHMLRQQHGAELANTVARRLVVPPHRQGGQAQFIDQPLPTTARESNLAHLIDWLRSNLQSAQSLDSLAERSNMSRRTFTRQFRLLTGTTLGKWLLNERLMLCQRLLETTGLSIEQISLNAGFGSTVSMRNHFRTSFGVTPTTWRHTFKG